MAHSPRQDDLASVAHADWRAFVATLPPASIDLLYADPPFNTGKTQAGRAGAYADAWDSPAAWAGWLRERLLATRPALTSTASVLIHVDWRTSHHARFVLDEVFGPDGFVNHLVWSYGLGGSAPTRFARKHDDLFLYRVDPERFYFEPPMVPATSRRLRGELKKATDVLNVPAINNMAAERTGYPTQKPLALLDLLIRACCPPDGLVLDPCCGSGTTLVAARAAGRRAVGCDTNPEAVALTRARLSADAGAHPSPVGHSGGGSPTPTP
jgi:DNA modification methylase